jgi:hypothetical protein
VDGCVTNHHNFLLLLLVLSCNHCNALEYYKNSSKQKNAYLLARELLVYLLPKSLVLVVSTSGSSESIPEDVNVSFLWCKVEDRIADSKDNVAN